MSIPRTPLLSATHAREVDAVEQHGELCRVELHGRLPIDSGGPAEATALEALVEDDEAAVVPGEDFTPSRLRERKTKSCRRDVFTPRTLRDGGEAIDAVAHVRRLAGEQDADRAGKQQHALPQPREQLGHVARGHVTRQMHANAAGKLDRHATAGLLAPR